MPRMAKKKETEEQSEGLLTAAAKAVGKAAGKVAKLTGADALVGEAPAPKKAKVPKFAPKNKKRLPRKVKKAQQKATSRKQPA